MQTPLVPLGAALPVCVTGYIQDVPSITVLLRVAAKLMPTARQFKAHSSFTEMKKKNNVKKSDEFIDEIILMD